MALSLTREVEKLLYSKVVDNKSLSFENIPQPTNILSLLSMDDIFQLNKIAKSKRLSSKPKEKFAMIDKIMVPRGFKKLAAGTNRLVYKYMENQSFVLKIAFCQVALTDNIRELYNQHLLKPFVTKVFEVTPCGTVGLFERVNPISSREQFMSIAPDVYDIIINHLIGRYVIDDFGSKYFMNWGVRDGQFPVLLDFPYVFELDGSKLYCNKPDPMSKIGFCGGEIDYDDGFNYLVCQKCGKSYMASDLRVKDAKAAPIIVDQKGDLNMKVRVERDGAIISSVDTQKETAVYEKPKNGKKPYGYGLKKREERRKPNMKVRVSIPDRSEPDSSPEESKEYTPDFPKDMVNHEGMKVAVVGHGGRVRKLLRDSQSFADKVKVVIPEGKDDPEPMADEASTVKAPPIPEEAFQTQEQAIESEKAQDKVEIVNDETYDDEYYDDEYYDDEYYDGEEANHDAAKAVVEIVDDDIATEY